MAYPGPDDPDVRRRWVSDRRSAIRRHHPDVGGETGELQSRLDAIDARFAREARTDAYVEVDLAERPLVGLRLSRTVACARRRAHRAIRGFRSTIPSGWPGSRRYVEL